jgi:4-alpha-glucanotransferase
MNESMWDSFRELEDAADREKELWGELNRARKALYFRLTDARERKRRTEAYLRARRGWLEAQALWVDLKVKYHQDQDNVWKEEDDT